MTTEVESYFKIDGNFVRVEDYNGVLSDENYIEGAIRCQVSSQEILGLEHWDLVDQLWAYIVDALVKLSRNEMYESSFPDQPLRLRLEPISNYCVKVSIGDKGYSVDRVTFVRAMSESAGRFFLKMNELCPTASDTWERYLAEVESIK